MLVRHLLCIFVFNTHNNLFSHCCRDSKGELEEKKAKNGREKQ
jgi:hypothetical protein